MMKKLIPHLLSATLAMTLAQHIHAEDAYKTLVDKQGNITLPNDYRATWSSLGSYFVKNAPQDAMTANSEASFDIHAVYTQASSIRYYRQHGTFPDGAVIIKDVNGTQKEALPTGEARYSGTPKVVFAMVKDSKGRFPNNQAWGEGWGWALFTPGEAKSQTTNWKGEGFNNCFGCHLPVKSQDWVYTQGYDHVLKK